jgi:hypothetical protein
MDGFMKYMGYAFLLILVYLVVLNGDLTTKVINSLSGANVNAILALQGRGGNSFMRTGI